jgi:hypothetical protein
VIVVDNIDLADVQLMPHEPFSEKSEFLFFIELLKSALDDVSFIVACQDTDRLCQVLSPTDEFGTDLLAGLDFVSTIDVTDVDGESNDRFAVVIDEEEMPVPLNVALCGGVEHFLAKWRELCWRMRVMESSNSEQVRDDAQFDAIWAAEQFVSLVLTRDNPEKDIHVTNILRLPDAEEL